MRFTTDNATCLSALQHDCAVAGATAWFWARSDAFQAVDVLFVDEAGQMSLANVCRCRTRPRVLVLLGDPQQLDQPTQGSHPDGTDTSALDHILAGHQTIPDDRGLFLEETWRLHPSICAFTSELFYEGRLRPRPGLESAGRSRSSGPLRDSGLRYRPVFIRAIKARLAEEAEVVADWSSTVLASSPTWINREGFEQALTPGRHPRHRAVQRPGLRIAERDCRGQDRHGRQISGPGSAAGNLFDDDFKPRRRAARNGISL